MDRFDHGYGNSLYIHILVQKVILTFWLTTWWKQVLTSNWDSHPIFLEESIVFIKALNNTFVWSGGGRGLPSFILEEGTRLLSYGRGGHSHPTYFLLWCCLLIFGAKGFFGGQCRSCLLS